MISSRLILFSCCFGADLGPSVKVSRIPKNGESVKVFRKTLAATPASVTLVKTLEGVLASLGVHPQIAFMLAVIR
jgi:hypothetical protein